jgi:hypothetical protein
MDGKDRKKHSDFLSLQKKWYDKLKKSGFEDIEWSSSKAFDGQDSRYLVSYSNDRDPIQVQSTLNWYLLVQNYITHAKTHPKTKILISKRDKILLNYYVQGIPYRKIIQLYQQEYTYKDKKRKNAIRPSQKKPRVSLFRLWKLLNHHFDVIIEWNKTHPEGRLYGNPDSFYAEDVLLNEEKFLKTRKPQ